MTNPSLLKILGTQHCVDQIDKRQNDHQYNDGIHRAPRDWSIQWISAQRIAKPQVATMNMVSVNIANSFCLSDLGIITMSILSEYQKRVVKYQSSIKMIVFVNATVKFAFANGKSVYKAERFQV